MPPNKDEPVSTAIIMVEEDEIEVIPTPKSEVIYIPEPKKPLGYSLPRSRRSVWGIIVGVLC